MFKNQNLIEGGNARYINRETGEIEGFADKIDLKKISRKELIEEIINVLFDINELFKKKTGEKLWRNFNIIKSGKALSGSSSALFDKNISDEEFIKYKNKIGDIDVTIPKEYMKDLWELLNDIEKKKLGKMTKYLGHKNSNINPKAAANLHQINAVFEINTGDYKINAQIDFEASDYDKNTNEPTKWASFSHSSDWEDIKSGFKGVLHKFALMNLARAQSKLEGIKVITPTAAKKVSKMTKEEYEQGKPVKPSKSKKYADPTNLAFSVAKGLRVKFVPVYFKDGKEQLTIDGAPVFVEIPTAESKYETNLENLFRMIFQKEPTSSDMKNFRSFVGLVKLMKKYLSEKIIEEFFKQLINKTLWCKTCQGLERNNPEGDLKIKSAMVNYLYENFPFLKRYKPEVDKLIEEYYKNYKMIEISESDGNSYFIRPGKLSYIFEQISEARKNL